MNFILGTVFSLLLTNFFFSLDKRNKRSRKRPNQEEGDITYINERNRVFNKKVCNFELTSLYGAGVDFSFKIARYYDKYTAEIRASFERGTAL